MSKASLLCISLLTGDPSRKSQTGMSLTVACWWTVPSPPSIKSFGSPDRNRQTVTFLDHHREIDHVEEKIALKATNQSRHVQNKSARRSLRPRQSGDEPQGGGIIDVCLRNQNGLQVVVATGTGAALNHNVEGFITLDPHLPMPTSFPCDAPCLSTNGDYTLEFTLFFAPSSKFALDIVIGQTLNWIVWKAIGPPSPAPRI